MREYHLASQNSISKSLFYASSIILGESYDRTRSIDILNVSDSKAISADYTAVYKNYSTVLAKISKKGVRCLKRKQREKKRETN